MRHRGRDVDRDIDTRTMLLRPAARSPDSAVYSPSIIERYHPTANPPDVCRDFLA